MADTPIRTNPLKEMMKAGRVAQPTAVPELTSSTRIVLAANNCRHQPHQRCRLEHG
jgi:hypothetical protein